ncbi:hypothetical protein MHU86_14196 [Fragilaria crotonensis]|nr:hypothetical protein MHU86_14196 [Fragilaria crotonensis]
MYHARDRNHIISLRKPALQRLINQRLKDRSRPSDLVHVPVLIRFLMSAIDIPKPPGSSVASDSVREPFPALPTRRAAIGNRHIRTCRHATCSRYHGRRSSPPSVNVDTSDDPVITVPTFEDNRSIPDPPVATATNGR